MEGSFYIQKLFSNVRYIGRDNDVHECHKQEI